MLEQAGEGVVDLGYEVADGVITIATQDFLDRKTYPVVYNISDLLVEIPEFTDAPIMDLRHATQSRPKVSEQADLPWRYGDDDDDEPEPNPKRQSRVRKIIELIQDTVAPQSWRDNGGSIGTIQEINGQLVVTQNSAAHRQLSGLLDKLREVPFSPTRFLATGSCSRARSRDWESPRIHCSSANRCKQAPSRFSSPSPNRTLFRKPGAAVVVRVRRYR